MRAAPSVEYGMRLLVACSRCRRQYDASGVATGSRFRCSCGETLLVPEPRVQDATVVRCSACGAPRMARSTSCSHCGSDYTLHEQDMHTICGSCSTRVSDRARYCHRCATPIAPQGRVGSPSRESCPACGPRQRLSSRELGAPPVAALECTACAGLWLGDAAFRSVSERARDGAGTGPPLEPVVEPARAPGATPGSSARYRQCPFCSRHMNRTNFGRSSGVIVDTCRAHGIWFDARELETVLSWIRSGGEKRAEAREQDEQRHAARKGAIANPVLERAERQGAAKPSGRLLPEDPSLLSVLLGRMFDL